MADLTPYRKSGDDTTVRPELESPPSTPTWVKVMGIIFLILLVLFVILHLAGGGMRMHGGRTLPYSVTEHSVQQP